jgi:urease accessory protein
MLLVTGVAGNINADKRLARKARQVALEGSGERLLVSRGEMQKARLRRRTDRGTDVGIVLDEGTRLSHGDVLDSKDKFIVVEQLPEKVISVVLDKDDRRSVVELAVLVGHIIGNRHKPLSVHDRDISFPVQNDAELEIFEKLLPPGVKFKVVTRVFLPSGDVHRHE